MEMNYYWSCSVSGETLHIGKSSYGWCFNLHLYPEKGINTLADWEEKFKVENSNITNGRGEVISASEMLSIIKEPRGNNNPWETSYLP